MEKDTVWDTMPQDDPLAAMSLSPDAKVLRTRLTNRLWESEELRPNEAPDELKESGAITMS